MGVVNNAVRNKCGLPNKTKWINTLFYYSYNMENGKIVSEISGSYKQIFNEIFLKEDKKCNMYFRTRK